MHSLRPGGHGAGVYQTPMPFTSLASSVPGLFICSVQSVLATVVACDLYVQVTDIAFEGGQRLQSVMGSWAASGMWPFDADDASLL